MPVSSSERSSGPCKGAPAAFSTPAPRFDRMAQHTFGWFGWFSAAGFVALGALYLVDLVATDLWRFSPFWTLVVALIAGVGALALYFGDDPTAGERPRSTA